MNDAVASVIAGLIVLVGGIILLAGFGLLMAFPIMWTWNATMPYLFALPTLTWGKAWCLMFLSSALLKKSTTINNKKK